eukprot:CAMPEP_0183339402 /NCGR_PEP_ID=MMETSP0164_2-20130417/6340_1 /TAXON_ID=221442 /ORGANISM="Coccolithus pelagicus ssp braarudi, Strain PLY182g" /LENGTH=77 /DNA_ID=CAMNT_0025509385 /DNA_START=103 /DNA_END=333 /DNA_ORIENTATION=-
MQYLQRLAGTSGSVERVFHAAALGTGPDVGASALAHFKLDISLSGAISFGLKRLRSVPPPPAAPSSTALRFGVREPT